MPYFMVTRKRGEPGCPLGAFVHAGRNSTPMKLYYHPGACSLAPHIVARALGLNIELVKIDRQKRTEHGADFLAINPKGYVPALQLADGRVLTEGPVIAQYLADLKPDAGLVPRAGSFERYRVQEMLGYINCELHKAHAPLFSAATPDATREQVKRELTQRYALIEKQLVSSPFIVGERFTIADAYLFTIASWAGFLKLDLSSFPALGAYMARIAERPEVVSALEAERGGN
jgi:glutathione S-transferase